MCWVFIFVENKFYFAFTAQFLSWCDQTATLKWNFAKICQEFKKAVETSTRGETFETETRKMGLKTNVET